jgi:hypothetical protein
MRDLTPTTAATSPQADIYALRAKRARKRLCLVAGLFAATVGCVVGALLTTMYLWVAAIPAALMVLVLVMGRITVTKQRAMDAARAERETTQGPRVLNTRASASPSVHHRAGTPSNEGRLPVTHVGGSESRSRGANVNSVPTELISQRELARAVNAEFGGMGLPPSGRPAPESRPRRAVRPSGRPANPRGVLFDQSSFDDEPAAKRTPQETPVLAAPAAPIHVAAPVLTAAPVRAAAPRAPVAPHAQDVTPALPTPPAQVAVPAPPSQVSAPAQTAASAPAPAPPTQTVAPAPAYVAPAPAVPSPTQRVIPTKAPDTAWDLRVMAAAALGESDAPAAPVTPPAWEQYVDTLIPADAQPATDTLGVPLATIIARRHAC